MFSSSSFAILSILFVSFISLQIEAISLNHPDDDDESGMTFGVIVDCGSSGTRAHIFQWDNSLGYPELLNDIEPMRTDDGEPITTRITPGLSSLKDDPSLAPEYMQPIFDFISKNIPENSHGNTGIYILGTAGMRLLDEETQMIIMNVVARELRTRYNFPKVKTSVISGAEEGMYQWITVNSKASRFATSISVGNREKPRTYGLFEMGGASLQVTFQLKPGMQNYITGLLSGSPEAQRAFNNLTVEPHISRKSDRYQLVSATFLGFGSNSAREAYVDMLIKDEERKKSAKSNDISIEYSNSNPYTLRDPCLPIGAIEIMTKPSKMFSITHQSMGFGLDNDDKTFTVVIHGTGTYSKCGENIKTMLLRAKEEKFNCKPDEICTMSLIGTPFVPLYSYDFLGVGEFYYTTKEMMNLAGKYNHHKVAEKTKEICQTPFGRLLELYPEANKNDPTRVMRECFKAIWIATFLKFGLLMPDDYDAMETLREIRGDQLDWTLGAVLDKSQAIERKILRWSFRPTDVL